MAKKEKGSKKSLALRQVPRASQPPSAWFDDPLAQKFLSTWFSGEDALWSPAIHVLEKDDKFVAKFELPGVSEEDIGISVIGDKLIVQGEKKAESEVTKKGYSYRETSYGAFSRSVTIPSITDVNRISANFDKGVLEIDLPKTTGIKPKKIDVALKKGTKAVAKDTEAPSSGNVKAAKPGDKAAG